MQDNGLAKALALAAQLGFAIAGPMVVFIGGGAWLDAQLNTKPWLLFAGIFLGMVSAGFAFYEVISLQSRKEASRKGTTPRAPYKVERDDEEGGTGTNRAVKRRRNGS